MSGSSAEVGDEPEEDEKQAAVGFKTQGNEAFKQNNWDRALELYNMAIKKDPTQMSFYNNKAAVYILKKEYTLAKKMCLDALQIGEKYGGCNADKARSLARIGKAFLKMGDLYNATWKYDEALSMLENGRLIGDEVCEKVETAPSTAEKDIDKTNTKAALEKKELGNEAYRKGYYDKALQFYDEAIELDPSQTSFYNNKGAVLIKKEDFLSAKNVCYEALRIGDEHGASEKDKMRSFYRIGKACRELGDIYNAMIYYERALSACNEQALVEELDKVYTEVKEALLRTDDFSKEKIAAAGAMITRIYIDRKMTYKTEYESPVMFPQAPQQTFVDAFTEEDNSKKCLKQKDQQMQYAAEVDLYAALEALISKHSKIIVLHNFNFSKEQVELFSGNSECSSGEHDFVVIVRGYAVILFEVKSPYQITEKIFRRNLNDSKKQLKRIQQLIKNICNSWGVELEDNNVLKYTVFPKTAKAEIAKLSDSKDSMDNVLFQEDVSRFHVWWLNNITPQLLTMAAKLSKSKTEAMQLLEASLVGLWCTEASNKCNIDKCSWGYCINQIDRALKAANISQNIHNPVTKSVKVSPEIFKKYLGIDCLTNEQKSIFRDDKKCQFILGAAGSGKTVLIFGKIIQIFLEKTKSDGRSKKQFLFITGSMDLAPIEKLFSQVGMKSITSHKIYGGHSSLLGCLELKRNESFIHAFCNFDPNFDIFIMHHRCLRYYESFWPEDFLQTLTKSDIFSSVVFHGNYHTFVDDLHNFWDKCLASHIEKNDNSIYNSFFAPRLVTNLTKAMYLKLKTKGNCSYLWIAFDKNQMAYSLNSIIDLYMSPAEWKRRNNWRIYLLIRYNRDLEKAIASEMEGQHQDVFRCLSRNLRNAVGVTRSIENVRMHFGNSLTNFQWPGKNLSDYSKRYKLFKRPGHHIEGPKPRFILVKMCDNQEEIVHNVIRDELQKLLELGDNLCPEDVAIIADGFCPTEIIYVKGQKFEIPTHHMMKFTDDLHGQVTIRRVTDRNSIQASEWKAVIFVRNLEEFLDKSIPENIEIAVDGDQSVLESALTLYSSTQYIPLSRARVYLTVIGKLGGAEREIFANQYEKLKKQLEPCHGFGPLFAGKNSKLYMCEFLSMAFRDYIKWSEDKHLMYNNEEYEHYKRSDFVYSVVDMDDAMLRDRPPFDDIWFKPSIIAS